MLLATIRKDGPTGDVLRQTVIALCDEVIHLQRELDQVKAMAQRSERARMGTFR